jgi:hypothetical protein
MCTFHKRKAQTKIEDFSQFLSMRKDLLVETISEVCSKRLKLCLLTPKNEDFAKGIGLQLQQLNRTISQECSLEDNNGQHLRHPLAHLMRSSNKF